MRKQKYYRSLDSYWRRAEKTKCETGSYPEWVFDFVSIHRSDKEFTLISPLSVVYKKDGRRPRFEHLKFESFEKAKDFALRLCRRLCKIDIPTFVVNARGRKFCPDLSK